MTNHKTFIVLILAICLSQFSCAIYAPSLPFISKEFQCSLNQVEFSMYIYMFSLAISQLIYGPLSEGLGRKKPIIVGLSIMFIGSLVCSFATSIQWLNIGRLIQGLGAGSCTALWRPIFKDIFKDEELVKYSSYLVIFITFIIPSAPLLGGYLQTYSNWQANFIFMSLYTITTLIGILTSLKETNKQYHISKLKKDFIISKYLILLKSKTFMGICFSVFFSYGTFFVWYVIAPGLLIDKLGISAPRFGWFIFTANGSAAVLSGWLNSKYGPKFGIKNMLKLGWSLMFCSGILLIILDILFLSNPYTIMLPIFIFYFGGDFIWPNAFAKAFSLHGDIAGYAGSLYSFMQICGAALLPAIATYLPHQDPKLLGVIIIITSFISWKIFKNTSN